MKLHCHLLGPSTYSVGLAYEQLVINVLGNYSFQLKHIGGTGDKGQDFIGYWKLPNKKIAVVGQCKCYKKPVGPSDVREFEGVLLRKFHVSSRPLSVFHQLPLRRSQSMGIMASQSWFSPSALRTFQSSKVPMILIQILPTSDPDSCSHSPCSSPSDCHKSTQHQISDTGGQHLTSGTAVGGYVNELVLNNPAQKVLGNILISWKHNNDNSRELTFIFQ